MRFERNDVWSGTKNSGYLDYIAIWFRKAAELVQGTAGRDRLRDHRNDMRICQGSQVEPVWGWMKSEGIGIDYAHRRRSPESNTMREASLTCTS